jgi:hypothetical protein
MKSSNTILAQIARDHLRIATLETRRSDSLDFHDVAVWQLEAALQAAFDAGRNAASPTTNQISDGPAPFDDYEIQPCRRYIDADEPHLAFIEPCQPFEADFWTLYGHVTGEGAHAIGDFHTREHAEEVFARITGQPYATGTRRQA